MAAARDDDNERERLSWREIDQLRDGGRHGRAEAKPKSSQKTQEKIRQEALKKAEALFADKQQQPEYKKALAKLEDHRATAKFPVSAENFLKKFGLPEDWRGLVLFLDYADPDIIAEAMTGLQKLAESQSMIEIQGLKGKLRTLALTSRFPEIKEKAAVILENLSG